MGNIQLFHHDYRIVAIPTQGGDGRVGGAKASLHGGGASRPTTPCSSNVQSRDETRPYQSTDNSALRVK